MLKCVTFTLLCNIKTVDLVDEEKPKAPWGKPKEGGQPVWMTSTAVLLLLPAAFLVSVIATAVSADVSRRDYRQCHSFNIVH